MILDKMASVKVIIEIDGSAHDDRPGRRRTYKRNQDYDEMPVPFVLVYNKAEKPDWFENMTNDMCEVVQITDITN